ncbi:hypothetical protein [Nocardia miyunensis]|uniref:hypothetical protein n=1 Tax=Nocardia miyunensis TaxID=282684 RepID=UPI000AD7590D|nr:hypothetical protein [Nocardia miyunensis]
MDSQDSDCGREDSWRWQRFEDKSPLQVAWSAFDRIAREPVLTDSWPVPGPGVRSWGELREQLLDPSRAFGMVDAIWRWLIDRARQRWHERGGQAVTACVGLAVPMLVELAGRFTASGSEPRGELESEILTGFIEQVHAIDLDPPHLWSRLWSAMAHLARSWARTQSSAPRATDLDDQDLASSPVQLVQAPPGHPELLLADAVADGVITADAAELIALTRWESRSMISVADQPRGAASYENVRKQRWRAENKLVPWLIERLADPDSAAASAPETRTTPADVVAGQREVRRCA